MSPRSNPAQVEDKNYDEVMRIYGGKCILCGASFGVTVHELVPKSLAPKTWMKVSNRVTLCAVHHEYVHRLSRRDRDELLFPARDRALKYDVIV